MTFSWNPIQIHQQVFLEKERLTSLKNHGISSNFGLNQENAMSYRGDSPSAREKQLEKRLRHLSKNLEQAEKTIQELRRSLKVSQNEKLKFQQNLKQSLGKSQKLDELLKELKSFSEHESRSMDQNL